MLAGRVMGLEHVGGVGMGLLGCLDCIETCGGGGGGGGGGMCVRVGTCTLRAKISSREVHVEICSLSTCKVMCCHITVCMQDWVRVDPLHLCCGRQHVILRQADDTSDKEPFWVSQSDATLPQGNDQRHADVGGIVTWSELYTVRAIRYHTGLLL